MKRQKLPKGLLSARILERLSTADRPVTPRQLAVYAYRGFEVPLNFRNTLFKTVYMLRKQGHPIISIGTQQAHKGYRLEVHP